MTPKTQTIAKNLVPGDRFYKLTDNKKQVLELVDHLVKVTKYTTYSLFCKADGERWPHPILSDTPVVFLRHKTTNGTEPTTGTQTRFGEIAADTRGEGVHRTKLV
jgi:hypothetical protein